MNLVVVGKIGGGGADALPRGMGVPDLSKDDPLPNALPC